MTLLLINPPVAKPAEAPAGIARLAGCLRDRGVACRLLDLNLHCLLAHLDLDLEPEDTWSRRALMRRDEHVQTLRDLSAYRHPARYRRAVADLNRILGLAGSKSAVDLSLSDYRDPAFSPLASDDLLAAAEHFRSTYFFSLFQRPLDEAIRGGRVSAVGLSFSYLSQALPGFAVLGYIRSTYPQLRTLIGGSLITSWMNGPDWNNPFRDVVDHCFGGRGEQSLPQLFGGERFDGLGSYDYDDLCRGGYLAPGFVLPYAASDGCYWRRCTFCPDRAEGLPYLGTEPVEAMAELQRLVSCYRPALIHLLDNAVPPGFLAQLATTPPGAPWYGFARFGAELEELDFCRALHRSGCVMLKLGLESGSPQVLERMRKGIDLVRVGRILANLRRVGIATYVYLLFGTPGETEHEAKKTLEYVRQHHRDIGFLNISLFNMPLCSPEARRAAGRFSSSDLSLYVDFRHPLGWDRKAVRAFLQKRFRKDPLVMDIIRRDPPGFTSNHAPFFHLAQGAGGPLPQ